MIVDHHEPIGGHGPKPDDIRVPQGPVMQKLFDVLYVVLQQVFGGEAADQRKLLTP